MNIIFIYVFFSAPLKCSHCDRSFGTRRELTRHILFHNNTVMCEVCSQHKKTKHDKTFRYNCTYRNCDNMYNNKANLMAHMNSHMNVKPYCCMTCDKSFSGRSGMKYHQVHCDKSFSGRSGMKYHQVHCGQDKTIICTQCNKTFRRRANLKEHIRYKHGLTCLVCECGSRYSWPSGLARCTRLRCPRLYFGRLHVNSP